MSVKPKTYRCDECSPPCIIKIKKHAILLEPPDRWTGIRDWCAEGKLRPVKRGRPKKKPTSSCPAGT